MKDQQAFLALFSDEASTPNIAFMRTLEKAFIEKAIGTPRFWAKHKTHIVIGLSIIGILILVLALIFLPSRDMSDPTQDSLIETMVETPENTLESTLDIVQSKDANSTNDKVIDDNQTGQSSQLTQSTQGTIESPGTSPVPQPTVPPAKVTGFSVAYWNIAGESVTAPSMPVSAPNHTASTDTIEFNWGVNAPHASIQSDGFIARFTKEASDLSGSYKVVYSSDNGLRMHVNESVVFDAWNQTSSVGEATFTIDPALPITSIQIDYYELDATAHVSVVITKL
jgi:hypothetical protein